MMDLAEYLQAEVGKTSIRKVAKKIGISKTAVDNIANRRIKKMPQMETLEKIAIAYGLTVPAVVRMAGVMFPDGDKHVRMAHEIEQSPWVAKRFDELMDMDENEFNYAMDLIAYQRSRGLPPDSTPPQSTE
jgi:transcriptional regulator with XRE-family HTH domain